MFYDGLFLLILFGYSQYMFLVLHIFLLMSKLIKYLVLVVQFVIRAFLDQLFLHYETLYEKQLTQRNNQEQTLLPFIKYSESKLHMEGISTAKKLQSILKNLQRNLKSMSFLTFDKGFEKTVIADERLRNLKLITFQCTVFRCTTSQNCFIILYIITLDLHSQIWYSPTDH